MVTVRYVPEAERFEATTEGDARVAVLDVATSSDVWTLKHTEVPAELEGRGVGSALVRTALDHVRAQGGTIIPLCPFALAYLRRHPDQADLVHPRFRYMLRSRPKGAVGR